MNKTFRGTSAKLDAEIAAKNPYLNRTTWAAGNDDDAVGGVVSARVWEPRIALLQIF